MLSEMDGHGEDVGIQFGSVSINFVTQSLKVGNEIGLSIWLAGIDRLHDGLKHIHIALECDPAF